MRSAVLAAALLAVSPALAGQVTLAPTAVTEWKAVYGRVEARNLVPARTRIGGTLVELLVGEGDRVEPGQRIALVRDDKIAFQVAALDAQLRALEAQRERAEAELARGRSLSERGVIPAQRLEQLRTDVEVTHGRIAATEAERSIAVQQAAEGAVLAPAAGRVLTVPVTRGAVVMAGEPVATIGGGGFYLRLAIPERHAAALGRDATIRIVAGGAETAGRLAKIYPRIENGRVVADVEVDNLDDAFVDARLLVEVPVGTRQALLVPASAVTTRSGIDFVTVASDGRADERAVVLGDAVDLRGEAMVEVLTGLAAGDTVLLR